MKRPTNPRTNPPTPVHSPDIAAELRKYRIGWHPLGGYCRKFAGDRSRTYFGKVSPFEAIKACEIEIKQREGGNVANPEPEQENVTVREAINLFLTHLDNQLATGRIGASQRASYGHELLKFMLSVKGPDGQVIVDRDQDLGIFCKRNAPDAIFRPLRNAALDRGISAADKSIVQIRRFLDWCSKTRKLVVGAPLYSDSFDAPTKREKDRAKRDVIDMEGIAYWQPDEIREIVAAAKESDIHRYAQVLLTLNGGMGASDLSKLRDREVDWDRKCIRTKRGKTLVGRVVPLWPETIDAMRVSRAARPIPAGKEWSDLFFLTKKGRPLVQESIHPTDKTRTQRTDSLRNWFYLMLNGKDREKWKAPASRLRHLKRHRGGYYTLRSVFTTLSMGHGQDRNLEAIVLGQQFDRPILEYYVRDDQRDKLVKVVEHVRRQIWPSNTESPSESPHAG